MSFFFPQPRPKRSLLPPPGRKRKAVAAVDEVNFDPDARTDYLTGFRRRKQARIKHAQELAVKRAHQEKLDARKEIREERKKALEAHIQSVSTILLRAQRAEQEESSEDEEGGRPRTRAGADGDEWAGLSDEDIPPPPPPPPPEPAIDREDEFIDEDRYTTVTVEAVSVDREGLHKPGHRPEGGSRDSHRGGRDGDDDDGEAAAAEDKGSGKTNRAGEGEGEGRGAGRKRIGDGSKREAASKDGQQKKRKKRDFRYESKVERELTKRKAKVGRAKKAQKRRGE